MKYIRKHRGFVTLGIVSLSAAVATLAMLGAVTGFAVFCGSILGGVVSLGFQTFEQIGVRISTCAIANGSESNEWLPSSRGDSRRYPTSV